MIWALIASIIPSLAGGFIFIYFLKKGQFEDIEDVKYQMFRDENGEQDEIKKKEN